VTVSPVIQADIKLIYEGLKDKLSKIEGSRWLISGGAGFLGGYFLDLLNYCNENIFSKPCRVICIENFISGTPARIQHLKNNKYIQTVTADIIEPIQLTGTFDYIVHAASIASPTFYRKYPLKTIETNVLGLKNLLELGKNGELKSFLYFSTSEIYGDPIHDFIPTPEHYNGNVSCTGPRACYDESKRLGETLAVNYYREYGLPVKTVRPFNVYGPGLKLEDKRVIPDFFSDAIQRKKIAVFSDGLPTRSFCYVSDAVTGFMSVLLSHYDGEAFNVGNDELEVGIKTLADIIAQLVGGVEIEFKKSSEADYLTDNPQRRCPDLTKARTLLNYQPKVSLEAGLARTLAWYREVYELNGGSCME
jgi:UDP-glucuronate decarboxylase